MSLSAIANGHRRCSAAPMARAHELRVYVVEDNDDYFAVLKESLKGIPSLSIVGRSYSAQDAVTQIVLKKPDVVLIDIHLFSGNGLEVIRALRRRQAIHQPKVLAMSNRPLHDQSLQAGADWFYDKSAGIERMLASVRSLQR